MPKLPVFLFLFVNNTKQTLPIYILQKSFARPMQSSQIQYITKLVLLYCFTQKEKQ